MRALLDSVFGDVGFLERFLECPADESSHHAHLGGLAEHTVAVAETCDRLCAQYEYACRDLLLTAALLHDIGKVDALVFDVRIAETDQGRLLGHLVLSDRRLRDALGRCRPSLTDGLADTLSHVVLAHHCGEHGGGLHASLTIEAILLQQANALDASVSAFLTATGGASAAGEVWTNVFNLFGRSLYAGSRDSVRSSESRGLLSCTG